MMPYYLVRLIVLGFKMQQDINPLNDGKRELSGEKKVALGKGIALDRIKKCSKSLGVTVNDFMTAALSMAMKRYFLSKDDKKTTKINVGIPVSIRWEMYKTFESVVQENKFAPYPYTLHLAEDPKEALIAVRKESQHLKSSMGIVYATYFFCLIFFSVLPYSVSCKMNDVMSLPTTMAFSNTPGCVKPISYKGSEALS